MNFKGILKSVWGNPFGKRVEEGIVFLNDALKRVTTKSFEKYLKGIKTFDNVLKAFPVFSLGRAIFYSTTKTLFPDVLYLQKKMWQIYNILYHICILL